MKIEINFSNIECNLSTSEFLKLSIKKMWYTSFSFGQNAEVCSIKGSYSPAILIYYVVRSTQKVLKLYTDVF